jgi:hypothetical protein
MRKNLAFLARFIAPNLRLFRGTISNLRTVQPNFASTFLATEAMISAIDFAVTDARLPCEPDRRFIKNARSFKWLIR